jgi:hypothetical protein
MTFAFTLIYLWTLACLKLSQLCLYSRVFSLHLRYWIWLGTGVVIMWAIAFTFSFIFLCSPIKQQWSLERLGHCIDQILVLKSLILTNIFTDVFIFVLPIRSVWKLQMRKTEKVAVISCFALGAAYVSHLASQYPLSLLLATTSDNTQMRHRRHRPLLANLRHRPHRQPNRHLPHDLHALQHRADARRPLRQHPHAPPLLPPLENQPQDVARRQPSFHPGVRRLQIDPQRPTSRRSGTLQRTCAGAPYRVDRTCKFTFAIASWRKRHG